MSTTSRTRASVDSETTQDEALRDASRRWWAGVRDAPERLAAWLLDQLHGEATAAGRIEQLRDAFAPAGSRAHRVLSAIATQERAHAAWVAELLRARGIKAPARRGKPERYWSQTLPGIADLATGCAVGAHAERMRLARIEAIAEDPHGPPDVRGVFARILPQERFHERAFRALATPEALAATRERHALGVAVLGLVN
jgi:hypothetical protein